ncbi:unnamed protein product [Sphagnum balticum]
MGVKPPLIPGSGDDAPTPPPKITKAPRTRPSPARTRTPGGKRTKHTTTVAPRTQTASARQASTPQTSAATTAPPHTTTAHQHYAASTSTEQPETPPAPTLRLPDREPIGKADIPPKPATAGHEMRSIIILASVIGVIVVLAILLSICVVIRHQRQKRKQAASRSPHSQQHIIEQEQPMLRPKN